jgi:hypothetical protein
LKKGTKKPSQFCLHGAESCTFKNEKFFGSFFQKRTSYFLCLLLTACTQPPEPSDVEKQTAIWRWQAEAQDAANEAATQRVRDQLARDRAAQDAVARQNALQLARAVAAQQNVLAQLRPALQDCLAATVHRLAATNLPPAAAAQAVLTLCRPSIVAIARTVELVRIASDGLAADMAARLRPSVLRGVMLARQQTGAGRGSDGHIPGSARMQTPH